MKKAEIGLIGLAVMGEDGPDSAAAQAEIRELSGVVWDAMAR